jgi:co-chaperonin GroES (HSP10)
MIQAHGKYVAIEPMQNEEEAALAKIGLIAPERIKDKKRNDMTVVHRTGKVLSVGEKVRGIDVGDTVYYNPFDAFDANDCVMVDFVGIPLKLSPALL